MSSWKLASHDHSLTLDLQTSGQENNFLKGILTYKGIEYPVAGTWAASGSTPGRHSSAFSVTGNNGDLAPAFIAATGIMTGSGDAPTRIDIQVGVSSSLDGSLVHYSGLLLPSTGDMLDTFDHVVVLMLENRSFDNLLGYMYPNGVPANAPLGLTFEGVTGKDLSNPVPADVKNPPPPGITSIPVSPVATGNYYQPYPDPGETYDHINTQLFNLIDGGVQAPYNLPSQRPLPKPDMLGFVKDYIENYKAEEEKGKDPTYGADPKDFPWTGYKQIMECYPTSAVPVLTTLAEQFAVFDHWFCGVPSQTWCNRAFWNSGTSWGRVVNGPSLPWTSDSRGTTIFNQIQKSGLTSPLDWKIYSANPGVALTSLIHFFALLPYHPTLPSPPAPFPGIPNPFNHIYGFQRFLSDCAAGRLPSYSFVEPRFITPHNDMHPSSAHSLLYGPSSVGSVQLGELMVWQVYDAIRKSPHRDKTLLIITYDEHGGCYDHVPPPEVSAPDLKNYALEDDFDFLRLGIRVPMIMVSSHIAKNTVVNTPMHHGSFMKTVGKKWDKVVPGAFQALTARVADAPEFTEVFTSVEARPLADWPEIPKPVIPKEFWTTDFSQVPLSKFEREIVEGASMLPQAAEARARGVVLRDPSTIDTVGEALDYLRSIPDLPAEEPLSVLQ
jgi:phospholipase C